MQTLVKICGITNMPDAMAAAAAGADFLGYVFYAPSKRFVAPRTAGSIIREVRQAYPDIRHVGVFVDEDAPDLAWTRNVAGLDFVQLHGNESPAVCEEMASLGIDVIKALSVGALGSVARHGEFGVPYYLCDTHDDVLKGGTGRTFDEEHFPHDLPRDRTFLAGGLRAGNVAEIIGRFRPFAVDVSSGVETSPGIKSHELVAEFIANAKGAFGPSTLNEDLL